MVDNLVSMKIRKSVKNKLNIAKETFIELHPEMKHIYIPDYKIIDHLINYYMTGHVFKEPKC